MMLISNIRDIRNNTLKRIASLNYVDYLIDVAIPQTEHSIWTITYG